MKRNAPPGLLTILILSTILLYSCIEENGLKESTLVDGISFVPVYKHAEKHNTQIIVNLSDETQSIEIALADTQAVIYTLAVPDAKFYGSVVYTNGDKSYYSHSGEVILNETTDGSISGTYYAELTDYTTDQTINIKDGVFNVVPADIDDYRINLTNVLPDSITNPFPGDGITVNDTAFTIYWSGQKGEYSDLVSYSLYMDEKDGSTLIAGNLNDTSYTLNGLKKGLEYFWKIEARIGSNIATSKTWSFYIGYGQNILEGGGVSDVDGNTYKTVIIGEQEWMAENLRVSKYPNGNSIYNVNNGTQWKNLDSKFKAFAWSEWSRDSAFEKNYGALYTFVAAVNGKYDKDRDTGRIQGVCPDGWHMPRNAEWQELYYATRDQLEDPGLTVEALIADTSWVPHFNKTRGLNYNGFAALPCPYLTDNGGMGAGQTSEMYFWTADSDIPGNYVDPRGWSFQILEEFSRWNGDEAITYMRMDIERMHTLIGMSVRCVKD